MLVNGGDGGSFGLPSMSPAHKAFFPSIFQSFGPLVWTTDEEPHSTYVYGVPQGKTG
jgi:hypothetical protein